MKRRLAYLIVMMMTSFNGWSQTVVVTDDNSVTTGDASSVLDLVSISKGFLAPRMTEAQRTAINAPATSLLVYQTNNTAGYYYFDGTDWLVIAKGAGWATNGNDIYYNQGKVGIGTNTPGAALNVVTTSPTSGQVETGLFEGTSNTGSSNSVTLQLRNNSASNAKTYMILGGSSLAKQWAIGNDLTGGNAQNFYIYDLANFATRLYIDGSGNIGLGSNHTTPTEVLDVSGNIKFSGALMPNNDAGTSDYLLTSAGAGSPPIWTDPGTYFESYAWKLDGNSLSSLKSIGTLSNHDLPFITNNTEKMRLTASGRLGIGLSAPDAPLHVRASTPTSGITPIAVFEETRDAGLSNSVVMQLGNRSVTSNRTTFILGSSVSNKRWMLGTDKDGNNSQNFYLWDDASVLSRLYIDGTYGYTGFGTATPQALLHVYSHLPASGNVPAALFEGESDGGVVSLSLINNSGARAKTAFMFGGSTSTYQWSLGSDVQGNNEHNFYIYDEGSFNTRFFINSNGEIGIGNITPTEALDVTGSVKFSGAIMPNNDAGTSGQVLTSAGAGNPPVWTNPSSSSTGWLLDGNTVTSIKKFGTLSYHDLPFITNNVEKMRILADGKVGIGTNAPSQILDVVGNVKFSGALMPNNQPGASGTFLMSAGASTSPTWNIVWTPGGNDLNSAGTQNLGTTSYHDLPVITNNTERLRIKADGKVGIGTASPAQVLDVTGNVGFSGALMPGNDAGTSGYFLTSSGTNSAPTWTNPGVLAWKPDGNDMNSTGVKSLGTTSYHDLPFITANSERVRIKADGKVGIGTNAPSEILDVAGNVRFSGALMPNNSAGASGAFLMSAGTNTPPTWGVAWKPGGNDMNSSGTQNFGPTSYHDLPFITANVEKMRIKADGKVGIGNNAPTEILDVTGNVKFSGALMPNNTPGSAGTFLMSNGASTAPTWGQVWKPGGNDLNSTGTQNLGPTSYHDLPFITANTERMRIKADGKVGIGNTNPSEILDVTGNIKLSGNITGGTWAGNAIPATSGGTGQTSWTTGEIPYASATNTIGKLSPNTTSTKMYLSQVNSVPSWTSDISGTFIGVREFKTAGSGTYTPTTGTNKIVVHLIGGGGGGGGVTGANSRIGAASGGGAGSYLLVEISNVSGTYSYTVGAAGTGASAGANNGGTGGNTTFINGGTTYTAFGGSGGRGQAQGNNLAIAEGGDGAAISTNGDINAGGASGAHGTRLSGTVGSSGNGGSTPYGAGGSGRATGGTGAGAGNAATGHGAGGGGALSTASGSQAGGSGAPGLVLIYEYK